MKGGRIVAARAGVGRNEICLFGIPEGLLAT